MLTVCTWLWGVMYGAVYVRRVANGFKKHLKQPYRMVLITDRPLAPETVGVDEVWPIDDIELTKTQGCFTRLRMFDPAWQVGHGLDPGHRLVCVDLDVVVTGALDPLFDRPEPFVILQGANSANPCPFNGSLMMLRGGANPEVWADFSIAAARETAFHEFPDDQGWLAHKLPGAAAWQAGAESGVFAFRKPGWPKGTGDGLPADARLVVFPGWRTPGKFVHLPWVAENWR